MVKNQLQEQHGFITWYLPADVAGQEWVHRRECAAVGRFRECDWMQATNPCGCCRHFFLKCSPMVHRWK
uniref:Uncharacterized protein n=1 Tax=Xenopus tropicalis TaxID=8364 RepID=A0A1B8Y0N9_XENTR